MVTIRDELVSDFRAREALLNRSFGAARFRKTSERLRENRVPADGLAFVSVDDNGRVIGTVRLWSIIAGSAGPALLLGPLAVDCAQQKNGVGRALMERALATAQVLGHEAILLVGDAPYYSRFGFNLSLTRELHLPGPVDRSRFMGLEFRVGALDGAEGLVMAAGALTKVSKAAVRNAA